jgi:RHS repeat-associated protein
MIDGTASHPRRQVNIYFCSGISPGDREMWCLGGELLAEYAANTAQGSLQKEYGYRNGQLLITATVTSGWGSPPVLHDNPLLVGQTTVQSRHTTELRDAINALRTHVGLSAYSWLTSAAPGGLIKADPILEMRTALDQALGAPSPAYTAGLAQSQPILAIHIQELRNRVLATWQSGGGFDIRWLVSDQLGTPRMIFDQSGSLANTSRHDYLPFGEELFAGTGGRTAALGYTNNDGARQKFTGYEADAETGLNFAQARYQSSVQGRFTSVDPLLASASVTNPQSFNRYTYVVNNPVNLTDPTGMVNNYGDSLYPWEEDHWGDIPWTGEGGQPARPDS